MMVATAGALFTHGAWMRRVLESGLSTRELGEYGQSNERRETALELEPGAPGAFPNQGRAVRHQAPGEPPRQGAG